MSHRVLIQRFFPTRLHAIAICMILLILTFFLASCGGKAAVREEPARDEYGRKVRLTPEEKAMLRAFVPGGEKLTEKDIEEKLRQVRPVATSPKLIPPKSPTMAEIPSEEKLIKLHQERYGNELSHIRLKPLQDGKVFQEGRYEFEGKLEKVERSALHIRNAANNALITLDFSFTAGVDLSTIKPKDRVRGAFSWRPTEVGEVIGVVLKDSFGLLFATETRMFQRGLRDEDLEGITLRQKREDLGEPTYITRCAKVYFPDVVILAGRDKPIIVKHGQKVLLQYGRAAYLIRIVKSQHVEEVPCDISFEEAPWQLEYIIKRLDDPKEIREFEASFDKPMGSQFKPDAPGRRPDGDNPPNPKLKGDAPPK